MATCELTIELEEPSRIYCDGDSIRGEVVVSVDKETNCKGLVVSTGWSTHGRGNIDQGEVVSTELHSGIWLAGQEYRYAFELASAEWPPTYYGTLINVSHQVHARAKVPWAFDPKTAVEFPVTATHSPDDLAPARKKSGYSCGIVGWLVGGLLIAVLSVILLPLVPVVLIVGGLIWFFTSYLPKSVTGNVECTIEPERLRAGDVIRGTMKFTPKRESKINGVRYTVSCQEICVSGSGSNRKTHTHELLSFTDSLYDEDVLPAGQSLSFEFDYSIPEDAAPSLDLSDNNLKWQVEFRVDIPRWPDYANKMDLIVEPSENTEGLAAAVETHRAPEPSWLTQVFEQLESSSDDPEQLEMILKAIRDHTFDVSLEVDDRRIDRPIEAQQIHGGTWVVAYADDPDADIFLHCDDELDSPERGSVWKGKLSIVGFIPDSGKVIATVVS